MDFDSIWNETKEALADAYQNIVDFAIGVVEAAIIMVAAVFLARLLRRRVDRWITRTGFDRNVGELLSNGVTIGTYILGVTLVLAVLGASWTALVTILGASTVAIGLALQDVLRGFVAGIYLLLERPFAIGDRIQVQGVEGTVEGIDIRTTELRTDAGERVLVPSATVFANIVTNRSAASFDRTTIELKGVTTPLNEIQEAANRALANLDGTGVQPPTVGIVSVSEDGADVNVTVRHTRGVNVAPTMISRLTEQFPAATVSVEQG